MSLQGIGSGGGGAVPAHRCQLSEVWLGPHRFEGVQALFHSDPASGGGGGGLELSQHTGGIVCGGLLGRCTLLFDYARGRVALQRP